MKSLKLLEKFYFCLLLLVGLPFAQSEPKLSSIVKTKACLAYFKDSEDFFAYILKHEKDIDELYQSQAFDLNADKMNLLRDSKDYEQLLKNIRKIFRQNSYRGHLSFETQELMSTIILDKLKSHLKKQNVDFKMESESTRIQKNGRGYFQDVERIRILPSMASLLNQHAFEMKKKYQVDLLIAPLLLSTENSLSFVENHQYFMALESVVHFTVRDNTLFHELIHLQTDQFESHTAERILGFTPRTDLSNFSLRTLPLMRKGYKDGYRVDEQPAYKRQILFLIQDILTTIKLQKDTIESKNEKLKELLNEFESAALYLLDFCFFSTRTIKEVLSHPAETTLDITQGLGSWASVQAEIHLESGESVLLKMLEVLPNPGKRDTRQSAESLLPEATQLFKNVLKASETDLQFAKILTLYLFELEASPANAYEILKRAQIELRHR